MFSYTNWPKVSGRKDTVIKIISIHIPKTAGRSFYQALKWAYGDLADIPRNRDKHVKDGRFDTSLLAPGTEVLHGHFMYREIQHIHEEYDSKVIVWLRDPVARVISNYFYNIRMNQNKPWKSRSDIRTRLTLMDFARKPGQMNIMSRILEGVEVENLFFTGLVEHYTDHLEILAQKLGWPETAPQYHINPGTDNYANPDSPTQFTEITNEMKEEIREINLKDCKLYEKCRNLTGNS